MCSRLDYNEENIGESATTFHSRFKDYLKAQSLIYGHQSTRGYPTTLDKFSIVGREGQSFARTIKESIYIMVNYTLNRNMGKCNLPHIWDGVLINTQELQIKNQ